MQLQMSNCCSYNVVIIVSLMQLPGWEIDVRMIDRAHFLGIST